MMSLGMFVFLPKTAPYQGFDRQISWKHASNSRVGARPARQFIGVDDETITIKGALIPEITGGPITFSILEKMADSGESWPLINSNGVVAGYFVIEQMTLNSAAFLPDGTILKQEFSITLKRVDD